MHSILKHIQTEKEKGTKLIALLLDPDKIIHSDISEISQKINASSIHLIFVGGSTVKENVTTVFVEELKRQIQIPIVLFPGNTNQITQHADGILFLSLLSGDNPEYLIHQHVKAAPILKKMDLEVIATGYILIDGGTKTATQKVSNTKPISQDNISKITNTSAAAEYLGKQLVYLEAGSGAKTPVHSKIISETRKQIDIPIIVGGGLRSKAAIETAFKSGADIVVIGTVFEEDTSFLERLT